MFTVNEIAAAATVQATVDRLLALSDIPGMMDPESGYPASAEYGKRTKIYRAVELATCLALGFTAREAMDIRHRIAFEFQGTRDERVAVMGEAWVKNQEDRGLVPVRTT